MNVAIVGCGGSCGAYLIESVHGAQFDEVWALNYATMAVRHDLGFVMDQWDLFQASREPLDKRLMAHLDTTDIPFLTSKAHERWPASISYPIDEVVEAVGDDTFNNVGAYALGYGILKGVDMTLYGLDYFWDGHGTYEAGGQAVSYLVGLARGKGLTVNITPPSPLLDANTVRVIDGKPRRKLYGYVMQPPMGHLPGSAGIEGAPL